MRIALRHRIGRLKFSLVIGTITKVQGINSALKDGHHVVMWEFDDFTEAQVRSALFAAQAFHGLPAIHVSQSHPGGGYHAYCLARKTFVETLHIVSGTPGVDPRYIAMCAMRGHWTLRLTDKGQGAPKFLTTLPSGWPEQVSPDEFASAVNYEVWSVTRLL